MVRSDPAPTPWWLVPNILALDAPAVAAVWQRFLAARFGVPVPWSATTALAAAVWCVYLTDRYLDARRGAIDADRHRAAARRPRTFVLGALVAAGFAAVAASRLPVAYVQYGLAVGLGVTAYLALVHALAGHLRALPGGKELLVAAGFAAGVAVPLAANGHCTEWLPCVAAFGGLCWLNCRLIDRWESGGPVCWPDWLLCGSLLAAPAALPSTVGLAVAGAALGLLAVHVACRHRPRVARALADVVLLTPLVLCGAV
ncbi:hypothetical protein J0H58_24680 [bacterium]|nr:hypothetical protein [bacterium]